MKFAEVEMKVFDGSLGKILQTNLEARALVQEIPAMATEFLGKYRFPLKEKAEYIKAMKRRMQMDIDHQDEIEGFQVTLCESMKPEVMERISAQMDTRLTMEFGLDITTLKIGVDHYDLNTCEEINKFRELLQAGLVDRQTKRMEKHKLPEENMVRLMQEAAGLGKPSVKSDGTLTFDYMLEASKIVEKNI